MTTKRRRRASALSVADVEAITSEAWSLNPADLAYPDRAMAIGSKSAAGKEGASQ